MPLKPLIAALVLVVLWTLEGVLPFYPGRQHRTRHYAINLLLAGINTAVASLLFAGLLLAVTEKAQAASFGLLHWIHAPALVTWPLALVMFDAWQYGWHRLNHRVPLLWRFHAVHHSDTDMDASTAVRFHTGEIVFSSLARLAVLPLLGMTLPQLAVYETLLLPVILLHHSNVAVPPRLDAALRVLLVTPWMHRVHHSRYRPETDSNYASILSVWDRVFRTYRFHPKPREIQLGLESVPREDGLRFWRFYTAPFRRQ